MKYIILIFFFVGLIAYFYYSSKKQNDLINQSMINDFYIEGRVVDIKISTNHNFGILFLAVEKIDTGSFVDEPLAKVFYPYKVKKGKAEIYVSVPDGIHKGDKVFINSNKCKIYYYYKKPSKKFEGYIGLITEPYNIKYIRKHTLLR